MQENPFPFMVIVGVSYCLSCPPPGYILAGLKRCISKLLNDPVASCKDTDSKYMWSHTYIEGYMYVGMREKERERALSLTLPVH